MHSNDTNFLRGVSKFCDRVNKFPHSRLSSALHSFGVDSSSSLKNTSTQSLDKKRKGKIFVQPQAVKRRKNKNGSKNAIVKGMNVKKNPFSNKKVSTKRPHKSSINVTNNEMVAKKAGRHMASKTRFFTGEASDLKKTKN